MVIKTKHMGFRLSENDVNLLQKICKARGEDVSDFIRRSVRTELAKLNYLSNEEKKALGVTTTDAAGESNG